MLSQKAIVRRLHEHRRGISGSIKVFELYEGGRVCQHVGVEYHGAAAVKARELIPGDSIRMLMFEQKELERKEDGGKYVMFYIYDFEILKRNGGGTDARTE